MDSMDTLIELMRRIETHPPVVKAVEESKEKPYLTDDNFLSDDTVFTEMIARWELLTDSLLIDPDGQPNYANLAKLETLGYSTGPGEQDDFGWLTGKVSNRHVIYIFG